MFITIALWLAIAVALGSLFSVYLPHRHERARRRVAVGIAISVCGAFAIAGITLAADINPLRSLDPHCSLEAIVGSLLALWLRRHWLHSQPSPYRDRSSSIPTGLLHHLTTPSGATLPPRPTLPPRTHKPTPVLKT